MVVASALTVLSRLPLGFARALGRGIGSLAFHLRVDARRQAEENLRLAYGDEHSEAERRSLARSVLRHFGETVFESIVMHRWGPEKILERTPIEGLSEAIACIQSGLEDGKGVVLITGHMGQWDLVSCVGGQLFEPAAMIARRFEVDGYQKFFDRIREGFGTPRRIFQGESIWNVARVLRKNGVVGIAADQDTKRVPGRFVPFFGQPAYTPEGPATLALAVGSPIVVFCIVRVPGGYRAVASGPIRPEPKARSNEREDSAEESDPNLSLTCLWTAALEQVIREYPDQWSWNHRRWRTTPELVEKRKQRKLIELELEAARSEEAAGSDSQ